VPFQRYHTTLFLTVLALLTAASGCREAPPVLKVGCQGDLAFRQSVELAIETIERSGSPVRVEAVFDEIYGWTPAKVVRSATAFFIDPDILAVIGFTSSDASLAAARIFNRHGIPLIIPTATSPKLEETGLWTFRLCPNDGYQACFLADIAWNRFKARRCAMIFQNNDYGRGLAGLFRDEFTNRGGEITFAAMAGSGFTKQDLLQLYVQGIVDSGPDLLVLVCQPEQAARVREVLDRDQIDLPLLATDSMGTRHSLRTWARLLDGLPLTLFYHPDLQYPGDKGFAALYRERTGHAPGYLAALVFDALMMLHQAVLEGARTREDVREYLASLVDGGPLYQGVAGPLTFNQYQEVVRPLHLGRISGGELILVPDKEELGR
jgi:branched-chain amino acid transport system substrate-binding protein